VTELRGIGHSSKAPAGDEAASAHVEHGDFLPCHDALVYHRLRLPHASEQVLGLDLNRSEPAGAGLVPLWNGVGDDVVEQLAGSRTVALHKLGGCAGPNGTPIARSS
jgi:hypothetical protein